MGPLCIPSKPNTVHSTRVTINTTTVCRVYVKNNAGDFDPRAPAWGTPCHTQSAHRYVCVALGVQSADGRTPDGL